MAMSDYEAWQIEAGNILAGQAEECGLDEEDTLYVFVAGGLSREFGEEILQKRARRRAEQTIRIPDQAPASPAEINVVIDVTDRSLTQPSS